MIQELRHALRMLVHQPAFTAVAVLTLALGIAANTAIFSVVDAVLLSPLPYPEQERLALAWTGEGETPRLPVSPADFLDWREQNDVFEGLAAFVSLPFTLTGDGVPERLYGASVSANFFQVLGVAPALGAPFTPAVDGVALREGVVLSHGLWVRRFGGDPRVIGRTVNLNSRNYEILGVMPARFEWPAIGSDRVTSLGAPELWVPAVHKDVPQFGLNPQVDPSGWRGGHYLRVLGRLKPGVALERAQAAMSTIAERLAAAYPETNARTRITVVPLREHLVGNVQPVLWALLGAVGLVLAIACANVANLFLARASVRRHEFAVRAALGAGRGRLVRQLLGESVLLALIAGCLGLLGAMWGMDVLLGLGPKDLPRMGEVGLDGRVLVFTLAVALGTGILFGLAPALHASSPDLGAVLRQGGGGRSLASRDRSRSALVVGEVALAVMLLIAAGLLLRSLWSVQAVELGFKTDHALTWEMTLPPGKYAEDARKAAFFENVLEQISALPGVESAGSVSDLPMGGGSDVQLTFDIEGRAPPAAGESQVLGFQVITPGYFQTMGIPLRQGRDITSTDREGSQGVAVLNEAAVRRFWPGQAPVGQRIRVGGEETPWLTVVGVVADVRHGGPTREVRPEAYVASLQRPNTTMRFILRTEREPLALAPMVREVVSRLDADMPIAKVSTLEEVVAATMARQRFLTLLVSVFAGLALVLASVGLYGVISYIARQRTQEIGIRMALGARPRDVLRLVLVQGMSLALGGVGLGLVGAWAASRALGSLLFNVSATDPLTFGTLALLVTAVALVATWLPAWRAMRVDPLVALRSE
ncbi:ABC transporter permease [Hyalangium versicolor]|uniref:ABC transporter permease n=1 Tax=Hyalangium versicolor TaxID=2861190 RepID=UPI001CCA4722|nr:ABC transporter permease [Hyalangium versicolor]